MSISMSISDISGGARHPLRPRQGPIRGAAAGWHAAPRAFLESSALRKGFEPSALPLQRLSEDLEGPRSGDVLYMCYITRPSIGAIFIDMLSYVVYKAVYDVCIKIGHLESRCIACVGRSTSEHAC